MSNTHDILVDLLAQHPELKVVLEHIADRCDRKGGLQGTLKLGEGLAFKQQISPLRNLLPVKAINVSRAGCVTMSFSALFNALNEEQQEEWITALYSVLGRERCHRPAERRQLATSVDDLLAKWRIAFPALPKVAAHLQANSSNWQRKAARLNVDDLRRLLFTAGEMAKFLVTNRQPIGQAELAARFSGDSKALRSGDLRPLLLEWLRILAEEPDLSVNSLLKRFNVVDNPTAIKVTLFGPVVYELGGQQFDWIARLWKQGQTATMSWDNVRDISRVQTSTHQVLTCENETPFCRLVRERHPDTIIYTEGFPNAAVCRLVELLPPESNRRHWGDTDLAGLRIAEQLNAIRPLSLWRCDISTIERLQDNLIPLGSDKARAACAFLATHPDFAFRDELQATIKSGWLEQEAWHPRSQKDTSQKIMKQLLN